MVNLMSMRSRRKLHETCIKIGEIPCNLLWPGVFILDNLHAAIALHHGHRCIAVGKLEASSCVCMSEECRRESGYLHPVIYVRLDVCINGCSQAFSEGTSVQQIQ